MMQRWSKTSRLIMGLGALLGLAIMAGCGGSSSSTPPGGNAVLNGRVLDAAGKPVPGVRITVAGRTATTDANGNYRLTGLPNTGTWSVSASKAGYQTFNTTVPAGTSSLPITLVPGTGATATLTGKVTDRVTGQAIAGAKLAVGNLSATSAADGTYRLAGVPAAGRLANRLRDTVADCTLGHADGQRPVGEEHGRPACTAGLPELTYHPNYWDDGPGCA